MAPHGTRSAGLTWRTLMLAFVCILSFISRLVSASSNVYLINNCPYNMYFWVVGPSELVPDSAHTIVPPNGGSVIHGMRPSTPDYPGGIAIKIRDVSHYEVGRQGIIQAEYTFEPAKNSVSWDLSAIDCARNSVPQDPYFCPFVDGGIKMYTSGGPAEMVASCFGGQCWDTYTEHGSWLGEPTWSMAAGNNIFFETCTHHVGEQTFDGSAPHPPSPPQEPYHPSPPLPSDPWYSPPLSPQVPDYPPSQDLSHGDRFIYKTREDFPAEKNAATQSVRSKKQHRNIGPGTKFML